MNSSSPSFWSEMPIKFIDRYIPKYIGSCLRYKIHHIHTNEYSLHFFQFSRYVIAIFQTQGWYSCLCENICYSMLYSHVITRQLIRYISILRTKISSRSFCHLLTCSLFFRQSQKHITKSSCTVKSAEKDFGAWAKSFKYLINGRSHTIDKETVYILREIYHIRSSKWLGPIQTKNWLLFGQLHNVLAKYSVSRMEEVDFFP